MPVNANFTEVGCLFGLLPDDWARTRGKTRLATTGLSQSFELSSSLLYCNPRCTLGRYTSEHYLNHQSQYFMRVPVLGRATITVTVDLQGEPLPSESAPSLLATNNVSSVPSAARQVKRNQTQYKSQTENRPRLLARFDTSILDAVFVRRQWSDG